MSDLGQTCVCNNKTFYMFPSQVCQNSSVTLSIHFSLFLQQLVETDIRQCFSILYDHFDLKICPSTKQDPTNTVMTFSFIFSKLNFWWMEMCWRNLFTLHCVRLCSAWMREGMWKARHKLSIWIMNNIENGYFCMLKTAAGVCLRKIQEDF